VSDDFGTREFTDRTIKNTLNDLLPESFTILIEQITSLQKEKNDAIIAEEKAKNDLNAIKEELNIANTKLLNLTNCQSPASKQVSPYQARSILLRYGLLDTVNELMKNASPEAKLAWEYATVFDRNSSFINEIAVQLSLSSEQIDTMFSEASLIL
jgi:hypothetical protein